jgi:peroxiredoxin
MFKFLAGVAALILAGFALVAPAAPIPRQSPDFSIAEPGGATIMLSTLKGKVVVMEFMFVKSEHCLRIIRTLDKLQGELGSRGLQSVGIVFDPPNAPDTGAQLAAAMTTYFKLTIPVGYASKENVDSYLGRAQNEVLSIPQVVVIDRTGTIRAASGGRSNPLLEDESSLRDLIGKLLDEGNPTGSVQK